MQLCTRCERIITADTICSIANCPNADHTKAPPPSAPIPPPKSPAKPASAKTLGAAKDAVSEKTAGKAMRGTAKSSCPACAADNPAAARFCRECGSPMEGVAAPVHPPTQEQNEWVQPTGIDPQVRLIVIITGALLLLGLLGYFAFGRGNIREELAVAANDSTSAAADAAATMADITGQETAMWMVADANIRDRATAQGSQLLGKSPRGTQIMGVMQIGEDGKSPWFRLSDGQGFVGAVNLSQSEPPKLVRIMGEQLWYAPQTVVIYATPDTNSPVLQMLQPGNSIKLSGITNDGFAEGKLNRGGVGYIAPTGFDFAAPAPANSVSHHYVTGLDVNGDNWLALKAEPNFQSRRIAQLAPDALLVSDGTQVGQWLKVETLDGADGWVSAQYVACCR